MANQCDACIVRDSALCVALDATALAALARHGTQRMLARGETLAWAGDEAMVCANLQAGVMKLVDVTAGGEESIVGLLFPGDFIGQPFAGHHGHAIVAATPVQICSFPRTVARRSG